MAETYFARAIKSGDTSRASTTTVTDDPDLAVALDSGVTYYAVLMVWGTSSSATPDFKYQFNYTGTLDSTKTSAAAFGTNEAPDVRGSGLLWSMGFAAFGGSTRVCSTNLSGKFAVYIVAQLTTTSSGTLSLQWAQNTSNATNVTVKAGSYLLVQITD